MLASSQAFVAWAGPCIGDWTLLSTKHGFSAPDAYPPVIGMAEDLWCLSTVYIHAITRLGQLQVILVSIVGQTICRFACAIVSRLKDVWCVPKVHHRVNCGRASTGDASRSVL